MISAKQPPTKKMRLEIPKGGANFNFEAQRNLTFDRFKTKLGKTAKEIKGIIEKLWFDDMR